MSYDQLRESLADVAFTTAVPFADDRSQVQHEELASHLASLYDAGARVFIPCGNTGEYYSLSDEERIGIVRTHVEAVGEEAVVAGGVAGSFPTVEKLVRGYEDAGADAIMVMHPDHTHIHETGLVDYYRQICDLTDLGVIVYKRGPEITRDVISAFSEWENSVAVKFAVNDVKEFSQMVSDAPGELTWINGIAERYALAFSTEGADGYTTGIGNFAPDATLALFEAIEDGNLERARRIRAHLRPYEDLREEPGDDNAIGSANNVPAVKYGMDLAGYRGGPVRAPLVDLGETDKRRAEEYFDRLTHANEQVT